MTPDCAFAPVELVVDRVIDTIAVVELADRTTFDLPTVVLPPDVREGDRLTVCFTPFPTPHAHEARFRAMDGQSSKNPQSRSLRVF